MSPKLTQINAAQSLNNGSAAFWSPQPIQFTTPEKTHSEYVYVKS